MYIEREKRVSLVIKVHKALGFYIENKGEYEWRRFQWVVWS